MNLIRKFNPQQLYIDGVLGQYKLGISPTTGIGGGVTGEVFHFRWTDSTRICAIQRVAITAVTAGAQQTLDLIEWALFKATAWTGQGTGGTVVDVSTGSNKLRSSMDNSKIASGDIRYAPATLGGGTKTLDANAMSSFYATGSGNPELACVKMIDSRIGDNEYPLVLQQNEGFVIKVPQNTVAGGFSAYSINVDWVECSAS